MRTYLYFRDVTNEDADINRSASVAVPADKVTGIAISSPTTMDLFYEQEGERQPTSIQITFTEKRGKETMEDIGRAMNASPRNPGLQVIGDNVTVTDGASSIQGNDQNVQASYISKHITSVSVVGTDT